MVMPFRLVREACCFHFAKHKTRSGVAGAAREKSAIRAVDWMALRSAKVSSKAEMKGAQPLTPAMRLSVKLSRVVGCGARKTRSKKRFPLEERERTRAEILAAVDEAEASLARGEGRAITPESVRGLAESVKQRGRMRLAVDQKTSR